ncbi:hypothetical protein SAMN05444380_102192 [Thermophagus xiamenensis]|uniref:Uncharacterized protein n=2 Tax=Thermophagus xiamenensis TaxID=385682 RepID=A0A1I1VNC4_9BACT|nr:hypothetical protein SAMN05444380_102192 [Thermophagus xiamenensis]
MLRKVILSVGKGYPKCRDKVIPDVGKGYPKCWERLSLMLGKVISRLRGFVIHAELSGFAIHKSKTKGKDIDISGIKANEL